MRTVVNTVITAKTTRQSETAMQGERQRNKLDTNRRHKFISLERETPVKEREIKNPTWPEK